MNIDGPIGTKVKLTVSRGSQVFDVTLIRASALSLGKDPEMYHE